MGHGYRPLISKIRFENPNKKGTKVKNYNLLRYIATREGVDLTRINTMEDVINGNIDLNDAGEQKLYDDASNDNYLKYIAHRLRSHGLFGNIDTEKFEDVSKILNKVSDEKKLVYRGIISLSELDAQALGYNNVEKWELYLKSVMPDIATTLGLSPNDITWVAAFHAEQKHPHVHYMLWDNRDIVQKAYIHEAQQKACRDICQNAMFTEENEAIIREITAAERKEYYSVQNTSRKNITSYIQDMFSNEYIPGIYNEKLPGRIDEETHKRLNELYKKIIDTLPGQGRIAYQYMPLECKAYIDCVTDIFLKTPDISNEYQQYIGAVEKIHKALGKIKSEILQAKNDAIKELYNRTGNIILKAVSNIQQDILKGSDKEEREPGNVVKEQLLLDKEEKNQEKNETLELDQMEQEHVFKDQRELNKYIHNITNKDKSEYNPVEAEKILLRQLEAGNSVKKIKVLLGSLYADNHSVLMDYDKAVSYLVDSIQNDESDFNVYVQLGKIYSDKHYEKFNPVLAEEYYLKAETVTPKNFTKLRLSRLYADSETELCDYEKAISVLEDANDTAGSVSLQMGNIYNKEDYEEYDIEKAVSFWKDSAAAGNLYGAYQAGRVLINERSEIYDIEEGVKYLEMALEKAVEAEENFLPAHMSLAKAYMKKKLCRL